MTKKLYAILLAMLLVLSCVACLAEPASVPDLPRSQAALSMKEYLESDPELMALMEKSIEKAHEVNPDPNTNPVNNIDELYDFIDWAVTCMPWNVLTDEEYPTLYNYIDQSIDYIWFLLDQPLEELEGLGYYCPTLEYHEPISTWCKEYSDEWGAFLSTEESWNDIYYQRIKDDPGMNMQYGWYADENVWHTFNEWFARSLVDPSVRPIANSTVVSPADAKPQGIWPIDENGDLIQKEGVVIKSANFTSVRQLIGPDSEYADAFNGGTLTHTFLDVNDYHRYHFPVSGTIKEVRKIPAVNGVGGITEWDPETQRYILLDAIPGWQMIETRDCVIVDTGDYGLVAVLPIGMSQICSCNWEDTVQVGAKVEKGDPMGYFLFGGSDIVMVFQAGVDVEFLCQPDETGYKHILMGEPYANLSVKAASSPADDFFAGLSQAWGGFLGMASEAGQAVSDWADESGVTEWVQETGDSISAWADESGLTEWAKGASQDIADWFQSSGITEWAEGTAAELQAFVDENGPAVEAWLAQAGEDVKSAWDTLVNAGQHTDEELRRAYEIVAESLEEAANVQNDAVSDNYTLEQVVILSRHNLRAPLSSNGSVPNELTPHTWIQWSANSSELTLKGGIEETSMGQYFRKWLDREGLIEENAIPEAGEVRFNARDKQRCRATARYFAAGMLPLADIEVEHPGDANGTVDFMKPVLRFYSDDYAADATAQVAALGGDKGFDGIADQTRSTIKLIMDAVDMQDSEIYRSGKYGDLLTDGSGFKMEADKEPELTGAIKTANQVADALILQYYEAPDEYDAAFGHALTEDDWAAIGAFMTRCLEIKYGAPLVSVNISHPLLQELEAELKNEGRKFSFFCAHDVTVYGVLAALGVEEYTLPESMETNTPIGVKLMFERRRDSEGQAWYRVSLIYRSTEQIRSNEMLTLDNPPMRYDLSFEGVEKNADGLISEKDLFDLFGRSIDAFDRLQDAYSLANAA